MVVICMRTIKSLNDLNIPNDYKKYITHYLTNLKRNKFFSHVNIFLIIDTELEEKEELSLMFDPVPYKVDNIYIPMDILLQSQEKYNTCKDNPYMVQKFIEKDGVLL